MRLLVEIVINLPPLAECKHQRTYTDRVTGKTRMGPRTDDPRQAAWKRGVYPIAVAAMRRWGHSQALTGPLAVEISCRSLPPKRPGKTVPDLDWDTGVPDVTNYVKLVEDALNGVVWEDDRQIVRAYNAKDFAAEECVIVRVYRPTKPRRRRTWQRRPGISVLTVGARSPWSPTGGRCGCRCWRCAVSPALGGGPGSGRR